MSALGPEVAAADFDNDQKPDGAVLLQRGQIDGQRAFQIELHVTAGQNATITFTSPEMELSISALDVNQDGAPDIVVEKAFTHERVQVYLNDGHGEFQSTSDRFATPSDLGSQCAAIAPQNLSLECVPPTRGFELTPVRAAMFKRPRDVSDKNFWLDAVLVQCGARAPSLSRAPPSLR